MGDTRMAEVSLVLFTDGPLAGRMKLVKLRNGRLLVCRPSGEVITYRAESRLGKFVLMGQAGAVLPRPD